MGLHYILDPVAFYGRADNKKGMKLRTLRNSALVDAINGRKDKNRQITHRLEG